MNQNFYIIIAPIGDFWNKIIDIDSYSHTVKTNRGFKKIYFTNESKRSLDIKLMKIFGIFDVPTIEPVELHS
jgi:hypothetical protein